MKRELAFITLLALGGCEALSSGIDTAKSFVYAKGAKVGNYYCQVRDPVLANDIRNRINTGLKAEGAKFEIDGTIKCDE